MPRPWDTSNEVPCRRTAGGSAPYKAADGYTCVLSPPLTPNLTLKGQLRPLSLKQLFSWGSRIQSLMASPRDGLHMQTPCPNLCPLNQNPRGQTVSQETAIPNPIPAPCGGLRRTICVVLGDLSLSMLQHFLCVSHEASSAAWYLSENKL